jgi:hypothetical protein
MRGYLDLLTVLFLGRYHSRPQHLFGGIGTLLFLAGLVISVYLSIDKIFFGHALSTRPLLLLGVLLMIVGVQLVSLGLLSELIVNSRAKAGPEQAWVECLVGPERARADVAAESATGPVRGRDPAAPGEAAGADASGVRQQP